MTRNKYCSVCGTEQVRGRGGKQKPEPSLKKRILGTKKKTLTSLLTIFVILGVSVPVAVNHLLKPHNEGRLYISSVNVIPIDQEKEQLQVMFWTEFSTVFVKKLELFSVARDNSYGSFPLTFELEQFEVKIIYFVLDIDNQIFYEGFSLKITHKYKVQWITYLF